MYFPSGSATVTMDRRSFLAAVGVAGVASGCLSAGDTDTTRPPVSIDAEPIEPPVVAGALELDPGTLWTKPGLRYVDGATTAVHEPTNDTWGYAELAIRNVGSGPVANPPIADFRLLSGGRTFAPVDSLARIDWESLQQREPRFGRTGYADPRRDAIETDGTAYCGLLFDFAYRPSPRLYWARGGGVTVAFSRVELF